MKFHVEPYEPEHLAELTLQPSQAILQSYMTDSEYFEILKGLGPAFTAMDGTEPKASFGLWNLEFHRALAWGLVSCSAGVCFPLIHKAVMRFLDSCEVPRIECAVDAGFEQGHRWARMLGFNAEGIARHYQSDGNDAVLYARIHPSWPWQFQ